MKQVSRTVLTSGGPQKCVAGARHRLAARDAGATLAEMEQVVALAASTIGLPAAVAAWSWVKEEAGGTKRSRKR